MKEEAEEYKKDEKVWNKNNIENYITLAEDWPT
jgi:hypothetical protein